MNAPILKRTRLGTLAVAVLASLAKMARVDIRFVWGFLGAAVWSVLGLWAVELLIRKGLVPPGEPRDGRAIVLLIGAKAALYAVAIWTLLVEAVPPVSCLLGFSLLLIVLVVVAVVGKPTLSSRPPVE